MTIAEKHRTEYRLIDQAINELTHVMQKIETLEAAAEEHRREAEELSKSETVNRKVIEQLEEQLLQEKTKSDALSMDLERNTAERNQLQAEIKEMQESMKEQESVKEQMALRDAERDKLKEDLERETAGRKEAVERLRNSFSQIQDLMNSVQHLMGPSSHEDR
jgi:predicted RNase H-like nuclease (RuvC/YqgF family)